MKKTLNIKRVGLDSLEPRALRSPAFMLGSSHKRSTKAKIDRRYLSVMTDDKTLPPSASIGKVDPHERNLHLRPTEETEFGVRLSVGFSFLGV